MKLSITQFNIPLSKPFEYFLAKLDYLSYSRIELTDNNGMYSEGEAPCSLDANGESAESSMALEPTLQKLLADTEIKTEQDVEDAMRIVNTFVAHNSATKCALEQALFGLLSHYTGKSLTELLDAKKESVRIQATIPFLENEETYNERFEQLNAQNPEYVKFKVGKNYKLEAWAINEMRSQNEHMHISVDANQAFSTVKDALFFLELVSPAKLSWAEQLIHKNDIIGWKQLKTLSSTALMADEDIQGLKDALYFLQNDLVDIINLKLAKCGGIIEGRKIIAAAKKYGKPVMLGSMVHSELGIKYNLAFALSQDFITHDFYSYFTLAHVGMPLIDKKTLKSTQEILI